MAVLGHPRIDERRSRRARTSRWPWPPLGAAPGDWGVALASDDVRDGALAISAGEARRATRRASGSSWHFRRASCSALAVAFGLLPPAIAPLASLLGALAAALHARASDLATRAASQDDGRRADCVLELTGPPMGR